ncbi:DUF1015 domain-containing protein [Nitrospina watsonii]|uniref:DUF1015 domain-containing protein n=1 Tax=Nitrospina watsonii TaxID=1323948 RepID=A0ABM9HH08_9BACT|nr:DUF1015 domain-containing protein [Nitrospina watsonii]CAI2719310.1 conserved protein of unknown function [Nitrospina watsonii]
MVDIAPFTGLLYNEEQAGPLAQLVAPPYDVIRPEQQRVLYEKNPYNVVRLILGKQHDTDSDHDNRYTRAARDFTDWMARGILKEDNRPGFYVYSQEYTYSGKAYNRFGFFARVRLEDFSRGNICPHEFTLAKAKEDRAQLIRACRANFSPVFGLFSDPDHAVDRSLETIMQSEPLSVIEEDGITHRFWKLTDPQTLARVAEQFEDKKVYIADGHHRYETALAYHQENGDASSDSAHVLMFLTNMDNDALAIYPIHRQIKSPEPFDRDAFLKKLEPYFRIEPFPKNTHPDVLIATLEEMSHQGVAFCTYLGQGDAVLLKLKDIDAVAPHMTPDDAEPLKVLDVFQLHTLVLKHIMGIDTKRAEHQQYITYNVRTQESMDNVDRGEFDLVFFMNATRIDQVRSLAEQGVRLPQKATYFYPKLLSGLVINRFKS